jgi:hypothetical protein
MRPRLRSFEVAWTDAAFDTIYPERGALPHGIASMHPARFFDDLLAKVPFEQSLGMRVTLWIIALSPLFVIRRFGTIASIAPEDRTRLLERLVTTPNYIVRQLAMSFKAIATLLYVQSDAVRAAMTTPRWAAKDGLISGTRLVARGRTSTTTSTSTSTTTTENEHAA